MSLTMVYFLNSLHSDRNVERLSSHSKIKISGLEKQAKPLFMIDFPLILHDLPYCHFKTGFCKTFGALFNPIIILYLQEYSYESCVDSFLELYFLSEETKLGDSKYTDCLHPSVKCSETI